MVLPVTDTTRTLRGLQCKTASTLEEWQEAFALVYQSYRDAGLANYVSTGLRITPFQLLPSTSTLIARHDGIVLGSLTLVRDTPLGLPIETAYPTQVATLRRSGVPFAELSSLATARLNAPEFRYIFSRLMRFVAQHARHIGVSRLLIATHPRHMPFYERLMGFKRCGDETKHPSVRNAPAIAALLDFDEIDRNPPPFYNECFDVGIQADALEPMPMPKRIADHFRAQIDRDEVPTPQSAWLSALEHYRQPSPAFV